MKLRGLQLYSVPGIDRPFTVEPAEQAGVINVITGRNASGKTTLLRAIRGLLYPRGYTDHRWYVSGDFVDETGAVLRVTNTGGATTWASGEQHIAAPALPDARFAGCYLLQFEDLAGAASQGEHGATEDALAEHIAQALTGGYKLKEVRDLFPAKASRAGKLSKELQAARKHRDQVSAERVALRAEQERLQELEAALQEAEAAAGTLTRVQDAEAYRKARRERLEIDATLEAMPPSMDKLTDNDLEQLQAIDDALAAARKRKTTAEEETRPAAEQRLRESGLADSGVTLDDLAEPRAQITEVRDAEGKLRDAREARETEAGGLDDRVRDLGGDQREPPEALQPEDVRKAATALGERREQQAEIRQLELAHQRLPGDEEAEVALDAVREARHALREWLAGADASGRTSRRWVDWLWLGVPLSIAAGWVAVAVDPAFIGLLVLGLAGVGVRWWRLDPGRTLQAARERFDRTEFAPPEEWTRPAVEARIEELETRLSAAEMTHARIEERRAIERTLDSQRRALADTDKALAEQAQALGFDPKALDEGFAAWIEAVTAYRTQRTRFARAEARVHSLEQTIDGATKTVTAFLSRHQVAPEDEAPSAAALEKAMNHLERRIKQRDQASDELNAADAEIASAEAEIERQSELRGQFFARRDLADGDTDTLRARLDRREEWRRLVGERERAVGAEDANEARLSGEEGEALRALAKADEAEALAQRESAASQEQEKAQALRDQIADIKARADQAGKDRRLEQAEAEVQRLEDELERVLEQGFRERAGAVLLEDVEAQVEEVQRPAALAQAQSWFGAFTDHAFELELRPGDPPVFIARDTATGEVRSLDALSSGTRMQLLLAVRLGFAIHAEGDGGKLPLFLDHALATSDPDRFASAAHAVRQIASEGRQVFYLTADPGELQRFKNALGEPAVHEIDIDAERGRAVAATDQAAVLGQGPTPLPSPETVGEEAFIAQLQIPSVDSWQGAGAVHPAYMLRDQPDLLYRLLTAGLASVGQIQAFLARHAGQQMLSKDERDLLAGRIAAIEAWVEAWCEGRGRPVGRVLLGDEASPVKAKRTTKFEEIAALADAHGGDPQALLRALRNQEVSGMRQSMVSELGEFLGEHGYLPAREPLSLEERRLRVLESLAGSADIEAAGALAADLLRRLEAGLEQRAPTEVPGT